MTLFSPGLRSNARLRFVDLQRLAVDVAAIERGDGGAGLIVVTEVDEAETLRLSRLALDGDIGRDQRTEWDGQIVELRIGHLLGEITHVEFHFGAPARPQPAALPTRILPDREIGKLRGVSPEVLT